MAHQQKKAISAIYGLYDDQIWK